MMEARYLGDGIYVKEDEDRQMILTTGTHIDADAENRIVFGEYEWRKLFCWMKELDPTLGEK